MFQAMFLFLFISYFFQIFDHFSYCSHIIFSFFFCYARTKKNIATLFLCFQCKQMFYMEKRGKRRPIQSEFSSIEQNAGGSLAYSGHFSLVEKTRVKLHSWRIGKFPKVLKFYRIVKN